MVNIWYSEEKRLVVDNPVSVNCNQLIDYLITGDPSSVIEIVISLMKRLMDQRIVSSGYELFRRRSIRIDSTYVLNSGGGSGSPKIDLVFQIQVLPSLLCNQNLSTRPISRGVMILTALCFSLVRKIYPPAEGGFKLIFAIDWLDRDI